MNKCPKCGNTWIVDRNIVHVITHSTKIIRPKGKDYLCSHCSYEWNKKEK